MKKTNKMMTGVLSALVAGAMAGCSSHSTMPDDYYLEETSFESEAKYESDITYEQLEDENLYPPTDDNLPPMDTEIETSDHEDLGIDDNETNQTNGEIYTGESITDPPADSDCSYWEWDEETGSHHCEDTDSSHANHYFYGGQYYANQHALISSANYQSSKSSYQSSSSGSYMSGIGSGSPGGFGG